MLEPAPPTRHVVRGGHPGALKLLDARIARLESYFGAQKVPESAAQERRRAANRVVVCVVLLVVLLAEFLRNRGEVFPIVPAVAAVAFGLASLVHAALLRRNPEVRSGRILVVDDRADVLDAMIDLIRELGFECDRALSASAATYVLATRHYDGVFVDIDMPKKNGVQLVVETRQGAGPNRDGPFIGMSASEVPVPIRERFDTCLAKPVDRSTLQRTLRALAPTASPNQRKLWQ